MLVTSAPVSALREAMNAVVADETPLAERPDVMVLSEIEALLTVQEQTAAAIAARLSIADAREATVSESGRGTRAWLTEEHLLDKRRAARKVWLGRQQGKWPTVDEQWRKGDISEEHAAVIYGALPTVPDDVRDIVEKTLLELARESTPSELSAAVDQILVACGVERSSDEAAARRHAKRGVSLARTFGGTGSLSGTTTPLLAEKLEQAFAIAGQPAGEDDDRTTAQRYHDALESIVDHFITTSQQVPAQTNGERTARVIVTVPLEVLERRLESAWASLPSGALIAPETARRLACDAEIVPAVLGGRNVLGGHDVVDIGQGQRTFSVQVRRAAVIRDGDRCVFPDCRNPRAEAHHWRVHWVDGGRSDLDNCAWLCGFHHWLVHERSWRMWREADGGYTFVDPGGTRRRTSSKVPRPDPPPTNDP